MNTRQLLLIVTGGFLLALSFQVARAQPPERPNVLVIVSDDHSWNQLGCAGDPNLNTPRIDELAAQGVRFTRAYATSPQCLPARASLLAGRSPVAMGVTRFTTPVPREVKLLPDFLRPQGYFTGIAGRSHHLDGWSFTDSIPQLYAQHQLPNAAARFDFARESNRGTAESRRVEFFAQLEEFFAAAPANKPFFLQFNLLDPHRPFSDSSRNEFARQYRPKELTLPADLPETPEVRADYALLLGMISRLDTDVGRVLDLLEERKLADSTLVVFIGDNGSAHLRGKGTLYDRGVRVPLVVRWPGHVAPGEVCDELISGEDLAPTIMAAVGLPAAPGMTGRSFLPVLEGEQFAAREALYCERGAHGDPLPSNAACLDLSRCVVTRTHKLIYNAMWQIPYWPVDFYSEPFWLELAEKNRTGRLEPQWRQLFFRQHRPMFELFDLAHDPLELNNLAESPEHAVIMRDLRLKLTEWMMLENDYLPLPAPDAPAER